MKKQIEMSTIVFAMVLLLGGGGCSLDRNHTCKNNDLCIPEASCVSNATTGKNWCTRWESPLSATLIGDWKDAVIGNPYEVDYEASGGFPPYTWVLNDGKDLSQNLGWLQVVLGGANNETAKLQNKSGLAPGTGDINASGIPIKITVFDSSIRGTKDRADNNGAIFNEPLKITGCLNSASACCYGKSFCGSENWGSANCNNSTGRIQKCWTDPADPDGCIVWKDQEIYCNAVDTCKVAGDGSVTCTCNTGYAGNTCNQCLVEYAGYPDCHNNESTTIDSVTFSMRYVPGGLTFPTGTGDDGTATVDAGFWMGETEVTYELWKKVYDWATTNNNNTGKRVDGGGLYSFTHTGTNGCNYSGEDQQQPVTGINWRYAMVWCNALTEWYNAQNQNSYTCAYYQADHLTPIRTCDDNVNKTYTIDGSEDDPFVKPDATGFRLPYNKEWELAARYIKDKDGDGTLETGEYYPGINVSGADAAYDATTGGTDIDGDGKVHYSADVAVFNATSTTAVKSKFANALGIYDMSGNVAEWCFEWYTNSNISAGYYRVRRGGDCLNKATYLQVGDNVFFGAPNSGYCNVGFRLARTK
jgi:sulfatase modifying factor 1